MGFWTTSSNAGGRRFLRTSLAVTALVAVAFAWRIGAAAEEMANGTLSAAIRASGHACARVVEKERADEGASVWRVRCNSGSFLVTMKGDSTFEVLPLD